MPGYEEAPIWNRSCKSKEQREENLVWKVRRREGGICSLPGDSDSWCCDADMADSRARHCSPVCSASCRCTRGSQTVPAPSAVASPVCGIWRVDFETKPAKKKREREVNREAIKALPDFKLFALTQTACSHAPIPPCRPAACAWQFHIEKNTCKVAEKKMERTTSTMMMMMMAQEKRAGKQKYSYSPSKLVSPPLHLRRPPPHPRSCLSYE